jgi:cyclopropane fatty-acyl-phospholipid synthase-like methyltransferase
MTEIELIVDLHMNGERQGPGSEEETLKALGFIDIPENRQLNIADLGCGTGSHTMTLAQHTHSHITAVDIFSDFLHELDKRAEKLGLSDRITTLEKSMDQLPFKDEEFDIIWSEGAIYNIGFENGVKMWNPFLKKGGYLAVSEITWTDLKRPEKIEDFWNQDYPEIDTAGAKISMLEKHGFVLEGFFNLSEDCWIQNYYQPLEMRLEAFLKKHNYGELAVKVADDTKAEIDLYQTYKKYYSYGFYIAKKVV